MKKLLVLTAILLILLLLPFLSAASAAPNLNLTYGLNRIARYVPGELIIKLKDSVTVSKGGGVSASSIGVSSLDTLNTRYGATPKKLLKMTSSKRLDRLYIMKFPKGTDIKTVIAEYKNDPNVEYAEPNYIVNASVIPNDHSFSNLWGLHNTGQNGGTPGMDIDALDAWGITTGSSSVVVGVIDTGIDYTHPDLAANIWKNPGEIPGNGIDDDGNGYIDDVYGWNFVDNNNNTMDDFGHGTHVAGTIGAVGNNNIGVVGVNWNVTVAAVKFLGADGSGTDEGAINAINYAKLMGFNIISNSWGGGGYSQALLDAINEAGAAGSLFIAAAGNSANNNDLNPLYPCAYNSPYILCVAATDNNDQLASFSNYGATTVDVAAPGVGIYSTVPKGTCGLCDPSGYAYLSGTSMATPHVSGAAALIKSEFPALNNDQIKARIIYSADKIPSLYEKVLSSGRLNLSRALEVDNIPPAAVFNLQAINPAPTSITLAWTAVGDDGNTGRASFYDIRYSTSQISDANFDSSKQIRNAPIPQDAGNTETFKVQGLKIDTTYYFAMKVYDNVGNPSPLSNVVSSATTSPPFPPECDYMVDSPPYSINLNNKNYCLIADVTTDTTTDAIIFAESVQNSTLDCRGFSINGPGFSFAYEYSGVIGINTRNNTVKNCIIKDFCDGITFQNSNNTVLINNTVYSLINPGYGVGFNINNTNNTLVIDNTALYPHCGFCTTGEGFNLTLINNIAKMPANKVLASYAGAGFGVWGGEISNSTLVNNTAETSYYGFILNGFNITLINNTANNSYDGFALSGSNYTLISNIANNSQETGFELSYASNSLINNIASNNGGFGVLLIDLGVSSPNLFYNNLFNNTNNVGFLGTVYANYWNTTKQAGTRVYSAGTQIGGNYWTNPAGNGYSDTCVDADGDGFCDAVYTLGTNNIDNLPYSPKATPLPLAALKGGSDGYLYIPDASKIDPTNHTTISYLKIEKWCNMSDTSCQTIGSKTLCGCNRTWCDQTGGTNPYYTKTNAPAFWRGADWPNGRVRVDDTLFIAQAFGSNEGDIALPRGANWSYMADCVLTGGEGRKVRVTDVLQTSSTFGADGTYSSDTTNIRVKFNNNPNFFTPDANGYIQIPSGAVNFTVYNGTKPVMALATFYNTSAGVAAAQAKQAGIATPAVQMPIGDTWTMAVVILAIIGLAIGYFIMKEALFVSTPRRRKRR